VFARLAEQLPSQKNTQLLSTLLPYYRMIAGERNLPESRTSEANAVIGECAVRTGNYALAGKAFRNMVKLSPDAFPVNQLAAILKKQGKSAEATELSRQVVARFADSKQPEYGLALVELMLWRLRYARGFHRHFPTTIIEISCKWLIFKRSGRISCANSTNSEPNGMKSTG
jgi:non-specific serine/threonine protein kinase